MGWILGAIFDWIAVGIIDKLAGRLPPWGGAALVLIPIAGIAAFLWLMR